MCDLVNHTHFPKEDHLPDWVCRDKHGKKGDRVLYQVYDMFWNCYCREDHNILWMYFSDNTTIKHCPSITAYLPVSLKLLMSIATSAQ